MRVPLLDLSEQYRALAEPIRAELDEVLASQSFILGPKVAAFEEAIAGLLRLAACHRRFFRNRCAPGHPDGYGDRTRRRRDHERLIRFLPRPAASRGSAPRRSSSISIPKRTTSPRRPWNVISPSRAAAEKTDSCVSRRAKLCAPSSPCISSDSAARWTPSTESRNAFNWT